MSPSAPRKFRGHDDRYVDRCPSDGLSPLQLPAASQLALLADRGEEGHGTPAGPGRCRALHGVPADALDLRRRADLSREPVLEPQGGGPLFAGGSTHSPFTQIRSPLQSVSLPQPVRHGVAGAAGAAVVGGATTGAGTGAGAGAGAATGTFAAAGTEAAAGAATGEPGPLRAQEPVPRPARVPPPQRVPDPVPAPPPSARGAPPPWPEPASPRGPSPRPEPAAGPAARIAPRPPSPGAARRRTCPSPPRASGSACRSAAGPRPGRRLRQSHPGPSSSARPPPRTGGARPRREGPARASTGARSSSSCAAAYQKEGPGRGGRTEGRRHGRPAPRGLERCLCSLSLRAAARFVKRASGFP